MKLSQVQELLKAEVLCCGDDLSREVWGACGSDYMSDVLAHVNNQGLLLTGLVNPQVIRTAEMMDIQCVVFVRRKRPDDTMVKMAADRGITLMASDLSMYNACGLLYSSGLEGE